jgi:hypothetical protein
MALWPWLTVNRQFKLVEVPMLGFEDARASAEQGAPVGDVWCHA